MYNFVMAAFPWVAIGLGVAIACANMDKIKLFWEKWKNRERNGN